MVTLKGLEGLWGSVGVSAHAAPQSGNTPDLWSGGEGEGCIEELLVCLEDHPKVNWLMPREDSDSGTEITHGQSERRRLHESTGICHRL